MIYNLKFLPSALKEWHKLDSEIRKQFKKKLAQRLKSPGIVSARLRGYKEYYKIKFRSSGYRLIYRVIEEELVVIVVEIGKRERVYELIEQRLNK